MFGHRNDKSSRFNNPALIRPSRLEVIIEIPEPDRAGREEILLIMMKSMVLGNFITIFEAKSYAKKISIMTSSWTGAFLSGLLRIHLQHGSPLVDCNI